MWDSMWDSSYLCRGLGGESFIGHMPEYIHFHLFYLWFERLGREYTKSLLVGRSCNKRTGVISAPCVVAI